MTDTSEITSGNDMIGATLALAQHYKASREIQDISYDLLAATAIISRGSLGYNEEEFLAAAKYIWKMTQDDSTDHTQWMINKWSKLADQEYMLSLIWGLSTGLVQSKALRQNQNLQQDPAPCPMTSHAAWYSQPGTRLARCNWTRLSPGPACPCGRRTIAATPNPTPPH